MAVNPEEKYGTCVCIPGCLVNVFYPLPPELAAPWQQPFLVILVLICPKEPLWSLFWLVP